MEGQLPLEEKVDGIHKKYNSLVRNSFTYIGLPCELVALWVWFNCL